MEIVLSSAKLHREGALLDEEKYVIYKKRSKSNGRNFVQLGLLQPAKPDNSREKTAIIKVVGQTRPPQL